MDNLNRDTFDQLFPFYFSLKRDLSLNSCGRSFAKLADPATFNFERDVELIRPKVSIAKQYDEIRSRIQLVFILGLQSSSGGRIRLKGQFLEINDRLVFCGSPWFLNAEELEASGLLLSDFAIHDTILDVLHYIDLFRHSNEDVARASEKILRQKQFYEAILDRIPAEIAVFDTGQRYLYANSQAIPDSTLRRESLGYKESLIMKALHLDDSSVRDRNALFSAVIRTGLDAEQVEHNKPHIGRESWKLRKYSPAETGAGDRTVISYAVDISAVKEAERKVAAAFQQVSEIIESIKDVFLAVDRHWKVIFWNERAEETFGIMREEILGADLRERCAHIFEPDYFYLWQRSMDNVHVERTEGNLFAEDLWYDITAYPFMGGLSIYIRDITIQKNYERQLETQNRSMADRTRQLRVVYHDLEQSMQAGANEMPEPLRTFGGMLELLEARTPVRLDARGLRNLYLAQDSADQARKTIEQLLDFLETDSWIAPAEPVNLPEMLDEVSALLSDSIRSTGAQLDYAGLPQVQASAQLLLVVFLNFVEYCLNNAEPEVQPRIRIRAERMPEGWKFCVENNGGGLSDEQLARLFEVIRLPASAEDRFQNGIDLSMNRRIIKALGGELCADAADGAWMCFYFTLPDR